MEGWRWALARLSHRLWVRAAVYGAGGCLAALLAALAGGLVPDAVSKPFGGGAVDGLLNLLAQSLLAVATFSTAAMLTAYTTAAQLTTPRAAALITRDPHAQRALATFVGAFLYAVVAVSALGTGFYTRGGRAILFAATVMMLAWVAATLLRWLDQLLSLARVPHAIDKVEAATREAIRGHFGAVLDPAGWRAPPPDAFALTADAVGYVANVDVAQLRRLAARHDVEIWVVSSPGALVHARRPLARLTVHGGKPDAKLLKQVRQAFDVGDQRSFDQDPRFGFVVLGEAAAKALSAALNDPGTAIDVIGTAMRLLSEWRRLAQERPPCDPARRVHLRPPDYAELLDDAFRPVAAYGSGDVAVAMRLQKALGGLAEEAGPGAIQDDLRRLALDALDQAEAALTRDADRGRVRQAAAAPCDGPS